MRSLVFSDIHAKTSNIQSLYNELKLGIYKKIEDSEDDEYDAVFITGDYFHHKMLLNELGSVLAIKFMTELIELCTSKNIVVRIIRGTKTHDFNQLEIFRHLESHYFRIFNSVTEETLLGHDILYVPEEYVEDQNEYYKEYFNKTYDSVFFHGTWSFVANIAHEQEGEQHIQSAPVFKYTELENLARGYIIGGHIHIHMVHQDKVIYVGPYSRNNFAELQDVGYLIYDYDKENDIRSFEFIKNENAPVFVRKSFDEISGDSFEDKVANIKNLSESSKVKVVISDSDMANLTESEMQIIKNTFSSNKEIKIDIKVNVDEDETPNEFSFVNDKSLTETEVIKKFIEVKHNTTISIDIIKNILASKD